MSELICQCINTGCGARFTMHNLISADLGSTVSIESCGTSCPKCRGPARILDGKFVGSSNGALRFSDGPPETRAAIIELRRVVALAKSGADEDDVVSELQAISPELGRLAKIIVKIGGRNVLVLMLVTFLASCEAKIDAKVDINVLVGQFMAFISGQKVPYPESVGTKGSDEVQQTTPEQKTTPQKLNSHHKSTSTKRQKRRSRPHCGSPRR